jgi:hypothetical protein
MHLRELAEQVVKESEAESPVKVRRAGSIERVNPFAAEAQVVQLLYSKKDPESDSLLNVPKRLRPRFIP